MTRGALTTFPIAKRHRQVLRHHPRDVPDLLPAARVLNIMGLSTPQSAILSAIIFNALIIIALIPLSLKGVRYRPIAPRALVAQPADLWCRRHHRPFIGIKAIDMAVAALGLA
ncbi:hypothetical protein CHY08_26765 (plasmid) [Rhizobium leguminosarum bv. viciae]|nr:hypothetical protein CHY08_26765 [Rhizobium leguminosarum bv. viciae]